MSEFESMKNITSDESESGMIHERLSTSSDDFIRSVVANAMDYKPAKLKISETWWRFALRGVLRGNNLLAVGHTGCGKTLLARSLSQALNRPLYFVNLGATQDPRSTLIGNTHFNTETGTFVSLSYFAQAIQVENAIILLDEVSRAHPEAQNILMSVLDETQRYLRVDERADSDTIKVADGVSFILTANIGSEYATTRTIDRALLDRCILIEMEPLRYEDEFENLRATFPALEEHYIHSIASVAVGTRDDARTDDPVMDTIISTRSAEQWASLVMDGFDFLEAASVSVEPYFSTAGGVESPRNHLRKIIQRFIPNPAGVPKKTTGPTDPGLGAKSPWGSKLGGF